MPKAQSLIRRGGPKAFFPYAILALISILPFLPSLMGPFGVVDDLQYIQQNPWIQEFSLSGLWSILTKPYHHNYLPLHLLSYALDHLLWGDNPVGYRAENILWHAACVLVAYVIFKRLLGGTGPAIVGALFFGVHPACVESVAWISERKNVMSQLFGLLSFWFYMTRGEGHKRYAWSLVLFVAALLSKSSMVVFPGLLIVYQWAVEGERNWKELIRDKLPHIALVIGMSVITVIAQDIRNVDSEVRGGGVLGTILSEAVVWVRFVGMTLWPFGLSGAYEVTKWHLALAPLLASATIIALFAVAFLLRRKNPIITFGIAWFFLSLLPVSNIIALPVALKDRYLYIPLIGAGMIMGEVWKMVLGSGRVPRQRRIAAVTLAALTVICLMGLTARQSWARRDPIIEWRDAVRVAPDAASSHAILSYAYLFAQNPGKMIEESGIAEALKRGRPGNRITAARVYMEIGMPTEALYMAKKMLPAAPGDPNLLATLGMAALTLGQKEGAERFLRLAVERGSRECLPYLGMGMIEADKGNTTAAIAWLEKAIQFDPKNADANLKLASLLIKTDPRRALVLFQRALETSPNHPDRDNIRKAIQMLKSASQ